MKQRKIPAVFMRGGTSNAIVFHQRDLPQERAEWDAIFLAAIGSPDAYGRQLDGMGGGISSLSKVCVIGPPSHDDADVDYTFAQVSINEARVDYSGNCGNMSSAMGPFAVDEGLVKVDGPEAMIRVHNTNTKKIIHAHFDLDEGLAAVDGDLAIPGVSGTGAPVRLEFREPGGASTGTLLPTGNVVDLLDVPDIGRIEASLVDAANAGVFVAAGDLGLEGTELPADLDAMTELLEKLDAIRSVAGVMMGLSETPEDSRKNMPSIPKVGFVAPAKDAATLSGEPIAAADVDLTGRMISMGQPHRALPLTGALCVAVAARIEGTVVHRATRLTDDPESDLRIAMPSGRILVAASVHERNSAWHAEQVSVYRTQRRLFEGSALLRASRVPALSRGRVSTAAE